MDVHGSGWTLAPHSTMDVNNTTSVGLFDYADLYDDLYPDAEKIVDVWYYMVGVAGSLVGWIGIICNCLSLGVLTSKQMRTTAK
ncbi:hypothetical protein ElyMa_002353600 [Elysia marginata]|uniref:G-protein coupled receptors family 1 profile domain-containing protein n=1 Tax=Elysia marginata TaxID=1093978 RepID=A0AAV4G8H7_9GAST|nr:hypothetical protein ElyMa_002353600 [Elysia marginata]